MYNMNLYLLFVSVSLIIGLALIAWSFTKSGKKWLASL